MEDANYEFNAPQFFDFETMQSHGIVTSDDYFGTCDLIFFHTFD